MIARYSVEYSPKAMPELVGIYAYISQDSSEKAEKMMDRILARIARLDVFPHRQQVHDARKRITGNIHSYPIEKYVAFF